MTAPRDLTCLLVTSLALVGCAGEAPTGNPPATADASSAADAREDDAPATPTTTFSFFITSTGGPTGGDLRAQAGDTDGLAGADALCQAKAAAAVPASATKTWRAYLSTTAINARDRIGTGPWFNAAGVMVATSVANLHDAAANQLNKANSIDENGLVVNGTGDNPNQHDILTGSNADGTAAANHCQNWTSSAATGVTAQVGHHDRQGGGAGTSWNAAHATGGCSQAAFVATGGRGSFYCFAL